jgi:hypothetical protein
MAQNSRRSGTTRAKKHGGNSGICAQSQDRHSWVGFSCEEHNGHGKPAKFEFVGPIPVPPQHWQDLFFPTFKSSLRFALYKSSRMIRTRFESSSRNSGFIHACAWEERKRFSSAQIFVYSAL